jgi:hypothetical protein
MGFSLLGIACGTVPDSFFSGESLETIESEQSLFTDGDSLWISIHYESTKNQIATNPLRENVKDPVRLNESL